VISCLKWPSWFLSIDDYGSVIQTYKGPKVASHQGAFWRIIRENGKFLLSPVFQAGYYCALSFNNEIVVDNFDKV
jgi:hypothetical protein